MGVRAREMEQALLGLESAWLGGADTQWGGGGRF